ncbi:hypothetical protein ACMD2_25784 [Ananas comosus]|uniref:Uncharacterized protein n=1 Tax=Ananas comosus TaxID=4615 RepID=A0A199UL01_ANACO|nr:hypothetical protein ACMD2_25784 [Ananas comosus]
MGMDGFPFCVTSAAAPVASTMTAPAAASAIGAPQPPPPVHHRLYEFAQAALIKIFAFPYATDLEIQLQDKGIPADIVCCLRHLQALHSIIPIR